jgi:hypothetical protein
VSYPHTHQQQGSIKRKHRHIVETGLSLLSHANMPLRYWDDAFQTACYLINRLPTHVIQNQSPFEKLFHCAPNYLFLKTFGCACWPNLRPYNSHKLQPRSLQCVFLGYSLLHRGYKCLHIPISRLYISRDVVFLETLFPFFQNNSSPSPISSGQSTSIFGPSPIISLQARSLTIASALAPHISRASTIISCPNEPTPAYEPTQAIPNEPTPTDPHEPVTNSQLVPTPADISHLPQPASFTETSPENSPTPAATYTPHPMVTRSKNFITKSKIPMDGTVRYHLPKALLAVAHGSLS